MSHILFGKLCVSVSASRSALGFRVVPPLSNHVLDVIVAGSEEEVIRVDAKAIVASVANQKVSRGISLLKGAHNSMSQDVSTGFGGFETAVARPVLAPFPNPTTRCSGGDLPPKPSKELRAPYGSSNKGVAVHTVS